jgi:UDP-glucose 4-epimerase
MYNEFIVKLYTMNILVTGGAGYIGSHMVSLLLKKGHNPIVIDNLSNSDLKNIKTLQDKYGHFAFYPKDIRNISELLEIKEDIDAIINFAALKSIQESVEFPERYYDNNIGGVRALVEYAREKGVKKFVFSSTANVYKPDEAGVFTEESELDPSSPYGYTKMVSERLLKYASDAGIMNAIALRYFNVCGNSLDGSIGETTTTGPNIFPSLFLSYYKVRPTNFTVYGTDYPTPDGSGIRDYIHVLDLCEAHLNALEYMDNNKGFDVFNLGTGTGYSVLEILEKFKELVDKNLVYDTADRRTNDMAKAITDPKKANTKLNWKAKYSLADVISSMNLWYKDNF